MGILNMLLRSIAKAAKVQKPKPARRSAVMQGFYWNQPGAMPLAAGRGFNQSVAGESFYHDTIERVAGGPTKHGVIVSVIAELIEGSYKGAPTLEVRIESELVGSIPISDLGAMLAEYRELNDGRPIVSKARVSAGFEGANYCVELSLARPLRVRVE